MKIKAINFDFYGTLVDWLQIWIEVAEQIVNENNLEALPMKFALEWRDIQRKNLEGKKFVPFKENILSSLDRLCSKHGIKNKNYDRILFGRWKDIKPYPEVISTLNELKLGQNVLIITEAVEENLYLSARNLPYIEVRDVAAVDPVCLIAAEKIVITTAALRQVEELLK